jgi:hypothetical protein
LTSGPKCSYIFSSSSSITAISKKQFLCQFPFSLIQSPCSARRTNSNRGRESGPRLQFSFELKTFGRLLRFVDWILWRLAVENLPKLRFSLGRLISQSRYHCLQRSTQTRKERLRAVPVHRVGFEPIIPVLER